MGNVRTLWILNTYSTSVFHKDEIDFQFNTKYEWQMTIEKDYHPIIIDSDFSNLTPGSGLIKIRMDLFLQLSKTIEFQEFLQSSIRFHTIEWTILFWKCK